MALVGEDKLWAELALIESFAPSVPLSPRAGQRWYDASKRTEYQFDGTGWVIMSEPTITTFVPNLSTASGGGTQPTFGVPDFRYKRSDGWLKWNAIITIIANNTGANSVTMDLPIQTNTVQVIGYGRGDAISGAELQVLGAGTFCYIYTYLNGYPGSTGESIKVAGEYQMITRYS